MCGIYGWDLRGQKAQNKVSKSKRMVLSTVLGMANDNRGGDSWGYTDVVRQATSRGLGDILPQVSKIATHSMVMCHTRKRTMGSIKVENSHPFEFGNIIGAHNGSVFNWSDVEKKYPERKKFEVDSMHIFAHINEGKSSKELKGYGAIEYLRKDIKGRVYLCKLTAHGELNIVGLGGNLKNCYGIVWSSSNDHLRKALKAAGLDSEAFPFETKGEEVYYVEDQMLYAADEKWQFGDEIPTEVKTYSSSGYSGYGGAHSEWPKSRGRVGHYDREQNKWIDAAADEDDSKSSDYYRNAFGGGVVHGRNTPPDADNEEEKSSEFLDPNMAAINKLAAEQKKLDNRSGAILKSNRNHVIDAFAQSSVKMSENVKKIRTELGMPMPDGDEWRNMTEAQKSLLIACIRAGNTIPIKNLLTEVRSKKA